MNAPLRRVSAWTADFAGTVWNIIWPPLCPACAAPLGGKDDRGFCPRCQGTFKILGEDVCKVCGRPMEGPSLPASGVCGHCLKDRPAWDAARSLAVYEGQLAETIKAFKFRGKRDAAASLGALAAEAVSINFHEENIDLVVPVPLHAGRVRERGFNQAVDLARAAAKARGVPLFAEALARERETRPQVGLTRPQRIANVKGAFTANGRVDIKGKTVLLVDDVRTTGATLNECARTLKKAGAARVLALTLGIASSRFISGG